MRKVLGILLLLTLVVTLVACNNEQAFDFDGEVLVVGLEADYRPFNWSETTANEYNYPLSGEDDLFVAGYDVEIAKIIAKELNMKLEIKMISWLSLAPALKSNQIDLIIAGMSPTPERMKEISFTNPYYNVNHVIVTKKGNDLENMTELSQLEGKNGVGQIETIYAELVEYVEKNYKANKLPVLDTVPQIATALETNKADFTIVEEPVALGMISQNPNLTIAFKTEANIFELSDADRMLSVGTRQIDTKLIDDINLILKGISQQTRDALMNDAVLRSK